MPSTLDRTLIIARRRADLIGKGSGGASWLERARATIGRHKYTALLAEQGIDGDEDLNSAAAFQERSLVKRAPIVKDALTTWWRAALSTARRTRPDAVDLTYPDYLVIYRALFREVVGADDYDEVEADECAWEEFECDTHGAETMNEAEFVSGMFELADLHVPSLAAIDYAGFLNELLAAVMQSAADGDSGLPLLNLRAEKQTRLRAAETIQYQYRDRGASSGPGEAFWEGGYDEAGGASAGAAGRGQGAGGIEGGYARGSLEVSGGLPSDDARFGGFQAVAGTSGGLADGRAAGDVYGHYSAAAGGPASSLSPRSLAVELQGEERRRRRVKREGGGEDSDSEGEAEYGTPGGGRSLRRIGDASWAPGQLQPYALREVDLERLLGPGRIRPDCVGCMGQGEQCEKCWIEERKAHYATIPREAVKRERRGPRESSIWESSTPQLWARRSAANLPRTLPISPPPGSPLYSPPGLLPDAAAQLLGPCEPCDEAEAEAEEEEEAVVIEADVAARRPAPFHISPSLTPAALPGPAEQPLAPPPPPPPRRPPLPRQLTAAAAEFAKQLRAAPVLPAPLSSPSPPPLPPQLLPALTPMPALPPAAPPRSSHHVQHPVQSHQKRRKGLSTAAASIILRPSRSLPSGGLACGYAGYTGYGRPSGGFDAYRRVLSSSHELPGYVAHVAHAIDRPLGPSPPHPPNSPTGVGAPLGETTAAPTKLHIPGTIWPLPPSTKASSVLLPSTLLAAKRLGSSMREGIYLPSLHDRYPHLPSLDRYPSVPAASTWPRGPNATTASASLLARDDLSASRRRAAAAAAVAAAGGAGTSSKSKLHGEVTLGFSEGRSWSSEPLTRDVMRMAAPMHVLLQR